jgi:hypothetical protein
MDFAKDSQEQIFDLLIPLTKLGRCSIPRATILKKMEKISMLNPNNRSAKSSMVMPSEISESELGTS